MLKGYTKIELTDVNTGEVEVIEDSNMVTNALAELASTKPYFLDRPLWAGWGTNDTMQNGVIRLTRGLMLLNKPLPEDPDLIMVPGGVDVTGAGAEFTYTGSTNLEMGSYNATESVLDPANKTFTWVWDFNETQANGEIGCCCLTTQKGGRQTAGLRKKDGNLATTCANDIDFYFGRSLSVISDVEGSNVWRWTICVYLDLLKNRFITIPKFKNQLSLTNADSNNILIKKSITLNINRIRGINDISLFDWSYLPYNGSDNVCPYEKIEVAMPQSLINEIDTSGIGTLSSVSGQTYYSHFEVSEQEKYINILFYLPKTTGTYTGLAVNDKVYVWKIDVRDWSSTWYTVTNTTGKILSMHSNRWGYGFVFHDLFISEQNKMVARATDSTIQIISTKNNNVVIEAQWKNGDAFTFGDVFYSVYEYKGKMFVNNSSYWNNSTGDMLVFDLENGHIATTNTNQNRINQDKLSDIRGNGAERVAEYTYFMLKVHGYNGLFAQVCDDDSMQDSGRSYGNIVAPFYRNDLLITINNLPRIIKKTPSQKMKVTYTIKEA